MAKEMTELLARWVRTALSLFARFDADEIISN